MVTSLVGRRGLADPQVEPERRGPQASWPALICEPVSYSPGTAARSGRPRRDTSTSGADRLGRGAMARSNGSPFYPLRLKNDAAGRRYLVLDGRAYVHEDDRP